MSYEVFPKSTHDLSRRRQTLAPEQAEAFKKFSEAVFKEGALSTKTKQLIAVAVAHVTQCPYCIRGHTKAAQRHGATQEEVMEAIWVAAEMRAGGAFAHSLIALDAMPSAPRVECDDKAEGKTDAEGTVDGEGKSASEG